MFTILIENSSFLIYSHFILASLGAGIHMRDAVKLPPGQNQNAWIAMNSMHSFLTRLMFFT